MADSQFNPLGSVTAPAGWTLPASLNLELKNVYASYNGSLAVSPFVPCLQIVSDSGHTVGSYPCSTEVAAAGSADVTWFPGRRGLAATPIPPAPPYSGPFAWYDFSDASTITLDGSGNIEQVLDKSGNGYHASQTTASKRPSQGTINGLQTGLFAHASAQALVTAPLALTYPQGYWIIVVFTQATAASAGVYEPGPTGGDPADSPPYIYLPNATHVAMTANGAGITGSLSSPFTQQIVAGIFDGTGSSTLWVNATPTGGSVNLTSVRKIVLGAALEPPTGVVTNYLDGNLCEVIYFEGAPTQHQFDGPYNYLKAKWATP